jgi:hypothetical protein
MVYNKGTISPTDLELLALHWVRIDCDCVAVLGNDGLPLPMQRVKRLMDCAWEKIAQACATQGYRQAVLYGCDGKQYPIPAMSSSDNEPPAVERVENTASINSLIEVPDQELSLELMEHSELPTYINSIETTHKLFVNSAGANAQGMPPEQFLARNSCLDLNDPPEYERRIDRVAAGETLRNYEYRAWRWHFDPNAGRFRTKRMSFVSHFRLVQYCGQPCWMGQVLQAVEVQ